MDTAANRDVIVSISNRFLTYIALFHFLNMYLTVINSNALLRSKKKAIQL